MYIYIYIYMYIYMWWCLFCSLTQNIPPREKGPRCLCPIRPPALSALPSIRPHVRPPAHSSAACAWIFRVYKSLPVENSSKQKKKQPYIHIIYLYIYIYIYIYIYVPTHIYIYICIYGSFCFVLMRGN